MARRNAHGIEPAAAARPPGRCAEFGPDLRQVFARVVEQLGWERACANARGIGFDDAEHVVEIPRSEARSRTGGRARPVFDEVTNG